MNHRPSSAVVLVVVVVLAGCSGGIPFTGDGSSANGTTTTSAATAQLSATDTQTTAESPQTPTVVMTEEPTPTRTERTPTTVSTTQTATTTPTAAANGTESNSTRFPPGYSASGITNPKRAVEHHYSVLLAHDSFTLTAKYPLLKPETQFTFVGRIDIADKRAYTTVNATSRVSAKQLTYLEYQMGNTYYVATSNGTAIKYHAGNVEFAFRVSTIIGTYIRSNNRTLKILKYVRFGNVERITRGGKTLLRYESTEPLAPKKLVPLSALNFTSAKTELNATVNAFNATVLVDTNGLIHLATYSITYTKPGGKRVTTNRTFRVSRINTTTVEKPAWLDEAKAQSGQSSTRAGTGNSTTTETDFAVGFPAYADKPSIPVPSREPGELPRQYARSESKGRA